MKLIDLTGQKFGRLYIIERANVDTKDACWLCNCDCGNENIIVRGNSLRNGNTISCGCYQKEQIALRNSLKKKPNKYDLTGEYGIGYTSKGERFYFDLEDYNKIKDYHWLIVSQGYVKSFVGKRKNHKQFSMHRFILGLDKNDKRIIDHINHHKADNRKINLRIVNDSKNQMNSVPYNKSTGIKGIHLTKQGRYKVDISKDGIYYYLGTYKEIETATKIRKQKEEELFGEYRYKGNDIY